MSLPPDDTAGSANLGPAYSAEGSSNKGSSSHDSASPSGGDHAKKTGRPNKWTASRQRKLARLYLYTTLSREEIPRALAEKEDAWTPKKESTTKTVNSLLAKEPRWLRPKDRADMERRIATLSKRKKERKSRRNQQSLSPEDLGQLPYNPLDGVAFGDITGPSGLTGAIPSPWAEFSETPLEDLLAMVQTDMLNPSTDFQNTALFPPDQIFPYEYQPEPVLPSLVWEDIPEEEGNLTDSTPGKERQNSSDDARSLSSYLRKSSLKRRLSNYSTQYVKDIARLMKAHSISDSSVPPTAGPAYSVSIETNESTEDDQLGSSSAEYSQDSTVILPDAFLLLDRHVERQGLCIPGIKAHDAKACWCLEDLNPETKIWVDRSGLTNKNIADPPNSLDNLDLGYRDAFGNTVLHMLAARGASITVIIDVLKMGIDGNMKNTADQSFLHVLGRQFFRKLAVKDPGSLQWMLKKLKNHNVMFYPCDHYGRNFSYLLGSPQQSRHFSAPLLSARDAFRWVPKPQDMPSHRSAPLEVFIRAETIYRLDSPREIYEEDVRFIKSATWLLYETRSSVPKCLGFADLLLAYGDEALVWKQTRLLDTARAALSNIYFEDSEGRSGLQCCAVASLEFGIELKSTNKRKRDESEPASKRLAVRHELIQKLLAKGVTPNQYAKNGNTVLMSFVTQFQDGEDDKTLAKIFHDLIKSGANLNWRNRQGETALHVAVRLGRKVATKVILEHGANVHARTAQSKGVLASGEIHYFRARDDPHLYASIMACLALAIQFGAVATPTLVQEWSRKR